jgi:hypothetical protein
MAAMTRPTFAVALLLVCATTLASGCGGSSSPVRSPSALLRVAARRVVRAMLPTIADYPGYERHVRTVDRSCPSTRSDSGTLAQTGGDAVTLAIPPRPTRTPSTNRRSPRRSCNCLVTSLRTSLRAGVVPGVVKTSVSPLDVGDEGSAVHVAVPLRDHGHEYTVYVEVGFYRVSTATGSLSIVAWPRRYPPDLFHAELDRLAERGRSVLRETA